MKIDTNGHFPTYPHSIATHTCGCDPYDILSLRITSFSRSFPIDLFIVTCSLSTTWNVENVLFMDIQVVKPPVKSFPAPSSLVHGYPSITLASVSPSRSSLYGVLPWFLCLVRCSHNHVSRATNPFNAIVWLPPSCPVIFSSSLQPAFVIFFFSLLISKSKVLLFFLICTWFSSSFQIFKCPRWMVSCNFI